MGWDWVVVKCAEGCGKYVTVPPDDPIAKDGWRCTECQYQAPNHRLTDFKTEGPEMSDLPQMPRGGECLCGCGTQTRNSYAPGHDAKHVAKLKAEVLAGVRSRSSALRQFSDRPMLKNKLRRALDLAEAQAKAKAVKPDATNNG